MRCGFCGFSAGFPHRHRPVVWQDVGGRPVCDDDCAEKERARQECPGLDVDFALEIETPQDVDEWRVIEPWWLVSERGHVMLEMDPTVGHGWYLMPRRGGLLGPFAEWQEAVEAT
jgi:hypothetical protein